jgi:hypothetical protein
MSYISCNLKCEQQKDSRLHWVQLWHSLGILGSGTVLLLFWYGLHLPGLESVKIHISIATIRQCFGENLMLSISTPYLSMLSSDHNIEICDDN